MITQAVFFGEAQFVSISANKTLSFALGKVCCVDATVGSLVVKLPSARQVRTGFYQGVVINAGANSFALQDNSGAALLTMAPGDAIELSCTDNLTSAGKWHWRYGTAGSSPDPVVDFYGYIIGASNSDAEQDDTREYKSQLDVWTYRTEVPDIGGFSDLDITGGSMAVVGAKGYVGGFNASPQAGQVLYEYDPDVWTQKTDSPTRLDDSSASALGTSGMWFCDSTYNDTLEYATGSNSWTIKTERPSNRALRYIATRTVNSKCFLPAGYMGVSDDTTSGTDSYVLDTFTDRGNRPGVPNSRPSGALIGSTLVYYGGTYPSSPPGTVFDTVQTFVESTSTWAYISNFYRASHGHAAMTLDGKGIIVGGQSAWSGSGGLSSPPAVSSHDLAVDTYTTKGNAIGSNVYLGYNLGQGITP